MDTRVCKPSRNISSRNCNYSLKSHGDKLHHELAWPVMADCHLLHPLDSSPGREPVSRWPKNKLLNFILRDRVKSEEEREISNCAVRRLQTAQFGNQKNPKMELKKNPSAPPSVCMWFLWGKTPLRPDGGSKKRFFLISNCVVCELQIFKF